MEYDLTQKILPFLDRHLIYPLLQFLKGRGVYDDKELLQLEYDLLKETNMTDYLVVLSKELGGKDDKELQVKKENVVKTIAELEESTKPVFEVLENPEVVSELKENKTQNQQLLTSKYGLSVEQINLLYKFGQFQYNAGRYQAASDILYHFRALSTDHELVASATWGRFACEILTAQWDSVIEELGKLRDSVDSRSLDPQQQLHQRMWVIHWALFPFFQNDTKGKDALCDLFFSSSYISTIQAACPWILRYLVVAVIAGGHPHTASVFQKRLKDLVRVVGQEEYEYQDPLTRFVKSLYIDYSFEDAQNQLADCEKVLKQDFFLADSGDAFLESARKLMSQVYCRVHKRVDIAQLSQTLNLTQEQGEKWIANLIKDSRMDAKIDESDSTVILNHPSVSVYQQVIEKTKGLTFRSSQVLNQGVTI